MGVIFLEILPVYTTLREKKSLRVFFAKCSEIEIYVQGVGFSNVVQRVRVPRRHFSLAQLKSFRYHKPPVDVFSNCGRLEMHCKTSRRWNTWLRSLLSWNIEQRSSVVRCLRSGTAYRSHFQGSSSP